MCLGNNHTFAWSSGNTGEKVPEGLPCQCGQTIAHYEKCPECGEWNLKPTPNQIEYEHYGQFKHLKKYL